MKVTTTTPKDSDKVNKIISIMQENFDLVMNLVRIKLLAFVLHALCVVKVSLNKIASAMLTSVELDSCQRCMQRFIAGYALGLDHIAKVIFEFMPVRTGLVLSLDRTNWKLGEVNLNIIMLGVTYKGVAFPLLFLYAQQTRQFKIPHLPDYRSKMAVMVPTIAKMISSEPIMRFSR